VAESPEAITETRSPGPKLLGKSPCLQNCRKLPVFQLAVCTELFHLVITDNQGPTTQLLSETDTLPPLVDGPSYKTHNPVYSGCCTLNMKISLEVWPPINLSFLYMVQFLFGSSFQEGDGEVVKRSGSDESIQVVSHLCIEAAIGISLYSYPYINQQKCFVFLTIGYVYSSTKLEKKVEQFSLEVKGVVGVWGEMDQTMYAHMSK
jgi:hypothetical protein